MNQCGYTISSLMEMAGQSVAHAVYFANKKYHSEKIQKILIICGPGNNGGDGIVAARHLKLLGLQPVLLVVKKSEKEFFQNLVKTCVFCGVEVYDYLEFSEKIKEKNDNLPSFIGKNYEMVIDAVFGFSFKPPIRKPFDEILESLSKLKIPIFSVDIPSGWDVEKGNIENSCFNPEYLISLTLPKEGAKNFTGKHFLGGRFVPLSMIEKYKWELPKYKELDQFIEL